MVELKLELVNVRNELKRIMYIANTTIDTYTMLSDYYDKLKVESTHRDYIGVSTNA